MSDAELDARLGWLLRWGVRVACAVLVLGFALQQSRVLRVGIALLIALPVVRVGAMLVAYLRARDYRMASIAAAVLLILAAGLALGVSMRTAE